VQQKLQAPDCRWDLVVCDEAHKMSATVFGGEVKYTKRYRLGQLLSTLTRHFLLMSATPHNGKEADFQLFMALLDGDRFEGRFRDGVHTADVSDLMRRMVKESLLKFDGTPLFPERIAYTVPYRLSDPEAALYRAVTEYVRNEFNRAEALENDKRAGTVGFALTILQRRLASSPEAIYQSLRRRRERLEGRLRELELLQRGGQTAQSSRPVPGWTAEDVDDLDEAPDNEVEAAEEEILDQATAARSIAELRIEIETLKGSKPGAGRAPQRRRHQVARTGQPAGRNLHPGGLVGTAHRVEEPDAPYGPAKMPPPKPFAAPEAGHLHRAPRHAQLPRRPHRDPARPQEAVVIIHGGIGREERLKVQEAFKHDPRCKVLLATDAAGEGINLQRAHLMVNYDLPWNPNRLEQRFGRIHRIGQTEVCHLWNLVADDTREGDVYRKLLEKLEQAARPWAARCSTCSASSVRPGATARSCPCATCSSRPSATASSPRSRPTSPPSSTPRWTRPPAGPARRAAAGPRQHGRQPGAAHPRGHGTRRCPPPATALHRVLLPRSLQATGRQCQATRARRFEITHVPAPVRNRDRLIGQANRCCRV
jgi:hypothetical protein